MWVLCDDGRWSRVEEVHDGGEWEVVYNMRVAESHTYLVGEVGRGYAVWVHNTCYEIKLSPTGLVQIFEDGGKEAVAKARQVTTLNKAIYYLANQQTTEADFNRVFNDLMKEVRSHESKAIRGEASRIATPASVLPMLPFDVESAAWKNAAKAIRNPATPHGTNYRVETMDKAFQLLRTAYVPPDDALPLRKQEWNDTWEDGNYQYGFQWDTVYEGDPNTNAPQNNLQHAKWIDNRTDGGHHKGDGHIYFGTWEGPHKYTQPTGGW